MNRSNSRLLARVLFSLTVVPVVSGCFTLEYSPDGNRLVFLWDDPVLKNSSGMAISNADGSNLRMLPSAKDVNFGHWSPDSTKLMYSAESGLWIYDMATNVSKNVVPEASGDSAWISETRIVFQSSVKSALGETNKLVWYDLATKSFGHEVVFGPGGEVVSGRESVLSISPVPRTDGVVLQSSGDLFLAEFGEAKRITTTGDVLGFIVDGAKDRVLFARRTKNPQFILLSLYEYDLRLRSVKKLTFPDHVPGINPLPRTGPAEITFIKFSPDFQKMLLFAVPPLKNKQSLLMFRDLYWVDIAGTEAKKLSSIDPLSGMEGIMATISPDSKKVALLYGGETTLSLASVSVLTAEKKVLNKVTIPPKKK